jgi:hypothetical protein
MANMTSCAHDKQSLCAAVLHHLSLSSALLPAGGGGEEGACSLSLSALSPSCGQVRDELDDCPTHQARYGAALVKDTMSSFYQ